VPSIVLVLTNAPLYGCVDGWHRRATIKAPVTANKDGVFDLLRPKEMEGLCRQMTARRFSQIGCRTSTPAG
jgi:hypothetical protein